MRRNLRGHYVTMIEIGDVREPGLMGQYLAKGIYGHARSFTSPAETLSDISVTPNKIKSYCIQNQ